MSKEITSYVPGVCNINTLEIAYRRNISRVSFLISIAFFALLLLSHAPFFLGLLLFLPLLIAVLNYLQAKNQFCVMYGTLGKHNANFGSTTAESVTDNADLKADMRRSKQMNIQAFAVSILLTLVLTAILLNFS